MSVEGQAQTEPALNRKKGRLTNRSAVERKGVRFFLCDCDCGRTEVPVPARAFNDGKVTACPECTEQGLAPKLYDYVRLSVTLDREVFATLGVDLDVTSNRSASPVRQALKEYALLVASADLSVVTAEDWEDLGRIVLKRPELLQSAPTPKAVLFRIAEEIWTDPESFVQPLSLVQALAVLATLRWRKEHPDGQGEWWRIEQRIGGE